MNEIKQVIILRTDLKMGTGKKCAQACHASVSSSNKVRRINTKLWKDWINSGQKKVVLKIQSLDELEEIFTKLKKNDIECAIINDAGLTQLAPGTVTALGIGPELSRRVDKITGTLKLL
ncbi:MAG: peptidyl-tRNA hydrolase Pth2 [Candidatus Lokiarchaeota archaeon]|nr:peptidyl-tRNA hydrolase Pth2 [Candidatus Lokiarchaeota archaeon]